jgi:hypothetical protein
MKPLFFFFGILFILICFWHRLSKSIDNKTSN